ncbi:MAG: DUF4129 domain-containing protein [Paracoccaceae bacterium]
MTTRLDMPRTESGEAYRQSVRYSRIETELYYIDRLNGEIPLGRPPRLERRRPARQRQAPDWQNMLLYGGVFAGLVILLVRAGGGLGALRVQRLEDTGRRQGGGTAVGGKSADAQTKGLAEILAMRDRKRALVLLLRHSLQSAAASRGLTLARSLTAREILRLLPPDWQYLPALRRLVTTGELVQFGGRDLSEATFEECVSAVRPMLQAGK